MCSIPCFNCLYVAPTENHTSIFSKQKFAPLLSSPFIRNNFFAVDKTDQVLYKQLTNMSDCTMRSCFLDPESVRGLTVDAVAIDELQNIHADDIPVIEECYTKSDYQYAIYCGTPKTFQHATEFYWQMSTQYEWLVRCAACRNWNMLEEECVQPQGLSCIKCGQLIDPDHGEWVAFDLSGKKRLEGFHVSQLMTKWIPWDLEAAIKMKGPDADERGTIMYKKRRYSRAKFRTEVMGLSHDDASCPITFHELFDACDPRMPIQLSRSQSGVLGRMSLYAGIDWSTSIESASYTVLSIGGFVPGGHFVVVFAKRYEGAMADLEPMLQDIVKLVKEFGVSVVGADWGAGADKNAMMRDRLRTSNIQVVEFNHSGTQKADVAWNPKAKLFIVNRTRVMAEVFNRIKTKDIVFPCFTDMKDFLQDISNVFSAFNEALNVTYFDHAPNRPDDFAQSLCFLHLTATIATQAGV